MRRKNVVDLYEKCRYHKHKFWQMLIEYLKNGKEVQKYTWCIGKMHIACEKM